MSVSSRGTAPRRKAAHPASSSSSSSNSPLLVTLGVLLILFSLAMLQVHVTHMDSLVQKGQRDAQERFRKDTTYHSSKKPKKAHKRLIRQTRGTTITQQVIEAAVDDNDDREATQDHTGSVLSNHPHAAAAAAAATDNHHGNHANDDAWQWPEPRRTGNAVVILVMSARSHVERRQVIRETWANGHDNVYFVIGQYCPINNKHRKHRLTCEEQIQDGGVGGDHSHENTAHTKTRQEQERHDEWYAKRMQLESQVLREEQEHYRDMLWTFSHEAYRGLPHKLKEGYAWVVRNLPNDSAQWIVKVDDDAIVRVASLSHYLQTSRALKSYYRNNNNNNNNMAPVVIGKLEYDGVVHQEGRWKEDKYPHERYPPFPLGSCGHVVSRPVAEYVAQHKDTLVEYQGEDTSLGIWMHEAATAASALPHVEMLYSSSFENDGNCDNPNSFVVGHDLSVDKIRECYENIGDEVQPIDSRQF